MRSSVFILGHYYFFHLGLANFRRQMYQVTPRRVFILNRFFLYSNSHILIFKAYAAPDFFYFLKRSLIVMLRCKPSCMNIAFTVIIISPIIWLPALVPLCKNNMSLSFQLLVKMLFRLVQINLYAFQHQFSYTTCLIMRCRITLSKTLSTMRVKVN